MKVIAVVIGIVLAIWAAAGHGCSSGNGGVNGEAGGGPSGGGGGAGGGGAVDVVGCPAAPVSGRACAPNGRLCTYGSAPRGECRDRATCVEGAWAVRAGDCAPPSDAGACPASAPTAEACTPKDQLCAYAGGVECVCVGSGVGWQCDTPRSPTPGCPVTPPNAGTSCAPAATCAYACGLLSTHAIFAQCAADGTWTWSLMPCANTNPTKARPPQSSGEVPRRLTPERKMPRRPDATGR